MSAKLDFKRREEEEDTCVRQGSSFFYSLTWETETAPDSGVFVPVPLAGWTSRMQVRRGPKKPLIVELSTENNRIILNPTTSEIQLQIANTDTLALPAGLYQYDLHLINPDGFVTTLVDGLFEVVGGITE